jgi:anti-anti-sigma factor
MSEDPTHGLLEVAQQGDQLVGRFTRRTILEPTAVDAVGQRLRGLVRDGGCRKVVLNFTQVESLTSAMLGQLAALHREVEAHGGRLAFAGVDPFLAQIFRICQIPQQIPIYSDEQQALAALEPRPG